MASFNLRECDGWVLAGWAFRATIDDLLDTADLPEQMKTALITAKQVGFFPFDEESERFYPLLRSSLMKLAERILSGKTQSRVEVQVPSAMDGYRDDLRELLEKLFRYEIGG